MNKAIHLLFFSAVLLFASSCSTLRTYKYSINNLDGKGTVNNNQFSVSYGNDFTVHYDAEGTFMIRNNKDSILYIDMGNTYFVDIEGQAERLFTNSIQTTYSSSTTGTSVNLGGVARVLGAGPVISTLASGVNVGGSNADGVSVQQMEEQYIGIPPYASVKIKFPALGANEPTQNHNESGVYNCNRPSETQILSYTYNAENPRWTIIRNQFVLDKITVEKHKSTTGGVSNDKSPTTRPTCATEAKNEVKYQKEEVLETVGLTLGIFTASIGVLIGVSALIIFL